MPDYTPEQRAAIEARGKIIVSASAGSGKTFVMIEKICSLLTGGGDIDSLLAVTFTKKAAAQIKEKLRKALIARLPSASEGGREAIKRCLTKIPSADISTIHSFCARLLRTYFYALGIDRSFDIVVEDSALADMKDRAMDNLFDRLYEEGDENFLYVLDCLVRKRTDAGVRSMILAAHSEVRNVVGYEAKLAAAPSVFSESGFEKVCADMGAFISEKCRSLLSSFSAFYDELGAGEGFAKLNALADEIKAALSAASECGIFDEFPAFPSTRRPSGKTDEEKRLSAAFGDFRTQLKKRYDGLKKGIGSRDEEYAAFLESGRLAVAFSSLVLQFDKEYTAVKLEENKLDPSDLEHLTLRLFEDEEIKQQINSRYKYVFVDEYQDVNPVQERILELAGGGDVFTVGDVKQAIYGFRGSKSVFFSKKYEDMRRSQGAMRLSVNFRSSDGVLAFVNRLFGDIMTPSSCGIDYAAEGVMHRGGKYPEGYGSAQIVVFGEDEGTSCPAEGIYSVKEHSGEKSGHTREGLAVLEIVRRELSGRHYSADEGKMVDTQPGDICILTRKNAGDSTLGIVRALTDAGYGVEGAGDGDLLKRTEIRQMLDILSLIDNCQQDIPLATAMLSPIGGFSCDELAAIRISQNAARGMSFRDCLVNYRKYSSDPLAYKIATFFKRINDYRRLSDILGASALIDKILADTGLGARYSSGGGGKLAGIRRLQEEAFSASGELRLNAFLSKIKAGGPLKAPVPASSDSIKVVTMHSSKGLEYPVVIVADIARKFSGNRSDGVPFDDEYGFTPRAYDRDNKLMRTTLLRELCARRASREEIKNELNLFYVACTRAMCNLYVLCGDIPKFDPSAWYDADCYAKMFDVRRYSPVFPDDLKDFEEGAVPRTIVPSREGPSDISSLFNAAYSHPYSVDLSVKTSASQLMREYAEGEEYAREYLFEEEYSPSDASGREAGTAYHKFLELCDFSVTDEEGIRAEMKKMLDGGGLTAEQAALLDSRRLADILKMPAFGGAAGAQLYREREFLCTLPACEIYDTPARDDVLVQGAIDLLIVGRGGISIVDYKFVKMSEEEIKSKYSRQLMLYRKAVSLIMRVPEGNISCRIIDLRHLREIIV